MEFKFSTVMCFIPHPEKALSLTRMSFGRTSKSRDLHPEKPPLPIALMLLRSMLLRFSQSLKHIPGTFMSVPLNVTVSRFLHSSNIAIVSGKFAGIVT